MHLFRASFLLLSFVMLAPAAMAGVPSNSDDLPYCPLTPVDPNAPVIPDVPRPVLGEEPAEPAPAPDRTTPTPATFQRASLWANVPNSAPWTAAVLAVVQARRHDLEQARDVETFCPGYSRATQAQRDICWLRLVGGVVSFESSFKADERPFCEGNGVYSVGLMALSTGECPDAMTVPLLKDGALNLTCGVNHMASLIARDHYIASDDNFGAAAYWSTLRKAHQAKLADGRTATLGKQAQIIQMTRTFNRY